VLVETDMARTSLTLPTALLLVAATVTTTQTQTPRPDFSGTWTMDEARSGSPGHTEFIGPVVWIIQQTAESMVVEIKAGDQRSTYTYTLHDALPKEAAGVPSYRGYFEGNQLITESLLDIQGKTVTMRQVRTLENDGREMIVERVVEVEHGYTLKDAQNYSTVKDVFVKAP
jgi:hypothetical protein